MLLLWSLLFCVSLLLLLVMLLLLCGVCCVRFVVGACVVAAIADTAGVGVVVDAVVDACRCCCC